MDRERAAIASRERLLTDAKAVPPKIPTPLLRSDASYIIVGGTGGIGRSITEWMVEKGARHVILVSRSGLAKETVTNLIEKLSALGANIVVRRCDVGEKEDVEKLVAEVSREMPPIRGVIHAAMVLRVSTSCSIQENS